ncbi:MAG: hypothetical protein PHQ40_21805 [Anaerolineaceae bacterium]|nr:hypothetical protein [Anaerolineaceae bacterium]
MPQRGVITTIEQMLQRGVITAIEQTPQRGVSTTIEQTLQRGVITAIEQTPRGGVITATLSHDLEITWVAGFQFTVVSGFAFPQGQYLSKYVLGSLATYAEFPPLRERSVVPERALPHFMKHRDFGGRGYEREGEASPIEEVLKLVEASRGRQTAIPDHFTRNIHTLPWW